MISNVHKKIYDCIKKHDVIVIARHIGPDPDALGSAIGLRELIKSTFPKKEVYTIGASPVKFKFMGEVNKVNENKFKDALLIVCDTPDLKRIDGVDDINQFKEVIKIDHHPEIDDFGKIKWIDDSKSSVCQMIIEFAYASKLKMTKYAAERLFMGVVSDTNRFLFAYTTNDTLKIVSRLIDDTKINFTALYDDLYRRPLSEIRLQGYMFENLKVSENGLGHIIITDDIIKKYKVDSASSGNLVNNFNNIDEVLVWVTFTYDVKLNLIRVNARSRGPIINKVLEKYNGGGHKLAAGAKIRDEKQIKEILDALEKLCIEYKNRK